MISCFRSIVVALGYGVLLARSLGAQGPQFSSQFEATSNVGAAYPMQQRTEVVAATPAATEDDRHLGGQLSDQQLLAPDPSWILPTATVAAAYVPFAVTYPETFDLSRTADVTIPATFVVQAGPDMTRINDVVSNPLEFSIGRFSNERSRLDVGKDLYSAPDFAGGLVILGRGVALKIGGYLKTDFIHDFNAIDATDSFNTILIPTAGPDHRNTRFHARQSRLSFDTRWTSDARTVRTFIEADFFSEGNRFRLRHAYGEVGELLAGQTWTTFTDVAAAPATLDFEGSVSNVNRRQAQVRWTRAIHHEDLQVAVSLENPQEIIEAPTGITGDARTPSPDFVARLRLEREFGQFQIAGLYRQLGFQPTNGQVVTAPAWGFNVTGVVLANRRSKVYYQILFGDGIGSYRGLPDAAPAANSTGELLGIFGWMVGITREWTDQVSSNFTYAENKLNNRQLQQPDDLRRTTYFAANLIWSPLERIDAGVEYLYGLREDFNRDVGTANRVQFAFTFYLP